MNPKTTAHAAWIREALERYEAPLLRYAQRLTGNPETARDVVQDTFLKLCAADRNKVEGHLAPWLYTVCKNRALDVLRKERPMNALTDEDAGRLATADPGPGEHAERDEQHSAVTLAIGALPESHRDVVRLKFQDGLSYKEISEITGHSVSHVGVILHTAIRRLRATLNPDIPQAAPAGGQQS